MIKVTLLFGVIWVLSTAAILKNSDEPNFIDGCKSESELWGSDDATKFCFCVGNNKSLEQPCPPNTFFVQNATVTGCIPLDEVQDNCVCQLRPQPCEGIYLTQPQPHQHPQKFYLCPKAGVEPVEMSCTEGAFVHENGWLGCVNWTQWRKIRGCN